MKTMQWTVDAKKDLSTNYSQISQAAQLLQKNEVVAFPTETVYGLGANAMSTEAVMKIYEAKGRPSDNPLIVHISKIEDLERFTENIQPYAEELIKSFWPGPLTIVVPCKQGKLSTKVTAGLDTVAVRMPSHPVAMEIIKQSGLPIAAPSANLSGKPSPTKAVHVLNDLDGKIAGIIDGGPTGVGLESTVVSCIGEAPVILRPGGITKEELERVAGPVRMDEALTDERKAPISPGMKYRHYAPVAPLTIVDGRPEQIQELADRYRQEGLRVGILTTKERESVYNASSVKSCGSRSKLDTVAYSLYDTLRSFDDDELDILLAESFPDEGVGKAIMNRLLKAAGNKMLQL
ncbi:MULTISPECIES: L-threonylcarbamoyladenylate synthase [Bacillus]|uniref:Threonylcarbamoyl-AMP synthase n=2 Tax=Bacillus TaxID=1386 RepID=A0A0M5JAG3_9BACI|nr:MULTISPECIES: L-threonylcarbamoyladenylate synthase [Bacillus]ALC82739.1 tRNA threonylcarbamoyladenosine biosynthesis protein [Bacillus gobiensis]MBP1081692.1 L-threonylcarbamoyladenylate synthase [Bacillus capparidis]MED1096345.1 L-threonylcarbamoyladenylate synthase [Bacillus capparidis]